MSSLVGGNIQSAVGYPVYLMLYRFKTRLVRI